MVETYSSSRVQFVGYNAISLLSLSPSQPLHGSYLRDIRARAEIAHGGPRHLVRVTRGVDVVPRRVHEEMRHDRRRSDYERPRAELDELEVRRHSCSVWSELTDFSLPLPKIHVNTRRPSWLGGRGTKGVLLGVTENGWLENGRFRGAYDPGIFRRGVAIAAAELNDPPRYTHGSVVDYRDTLSSCAEEVQWPLSKTVGVDCALTSLGAQRSGCFIRSLVVHFSVNQFCTNPPSLMDGSKVPETVNTTFLCVKPRDTQQTLDENASSSFHRN